MGSVLLCPLASPGFAGPMLALATHLLQAHQTVTLVSGSRLESTLSTCTAPGLSVVLDTAFDVHSWGDTAQLVEQFHVVRRAIQSRKPSVVVADQFAFGAIQAARAERLPLAVVGLGPYLLAANHPAMSSHKSRFSDLIALYNSVARITEPRLATTTKYSDECPLLGDVFLLRSLPFFELESDLPHQTVFMGPAIYPFPEPPDPSLDAFIRRSHCKTTPLFYLHLAKAERRAELLAAFERACVMAHCRIIVSSMEGEAAGTFDSDVVYHASATALARALPSCAALFSTGQTTPVYSAILAGVPNLILDLGAGAKALSARCAHQGAGFALTRPRHCDPDYLRNCMNRIQYDWSLTAAAARLQRKFRAATALAAAADVVVRMAEGKNDSPILLNAVNPPVASIRDTTRGSGDQQLPADVFARLKVLVGTLGSEDWEIFSRNESGGWWLHLLHSDRIPRHQGWKLHVSADATNASAVLERCVPVLTAARASFKAVANLPALIALNDGAFGISQVGKFITIYPDHDEHFSEIAHALSRALRDLSGPRVLTDYRLRGGSMVHCRYGGFSQQMMQTEKGEIVPAIYAADNSLVCDARDTNRITKKVNEPPVPPGVSLETDADLLGSAYHLAFHISRTPRGDVYLAADLQRLRRCVLKTTHKGYYRDESGRDAMDRLDHEVRMLQRVAPTGVAPALYEFFCVDGRFACAILEDLAGCTLHEYWSDVRILSRVEVQRERLKHALEIATALTKLHDLGIVLRDLKPQNILARSDGTVRLIDFESAWELGSPGTPFLGGTRGYVRPGATRLPKPADDIYAFGALLYWLLTDVDPSLLDDPVRMTARSALRLNPRIPLGAVELLESCLHSENPPSIAAVVSKLRGVIAHEADAPRPALPPSIEVPSDSGCEVVLSTLADRISDTIRAFVCSGETHQAARIRSHLQCRDLNSGLAGHIVCLAEFCRLTRQLSPYIETIRNGLVALHRIPRLPGVVPPGLYVGEAGVLAAALKGYLLLGDQPPAEFDAGVEYLAELPFGDPDIFSGTAGRLRFHIAAWGALQSRHHEELARCAAELLIAQQGELPAPGWRSSPPGSAVVYLGYAHGAAGIADALLDFYRCTNAEVAINAVIRVAQWLSELAIPVLDDEGCLDWPAVEGLGPAAGRWCHGAGGIGRFFLNLAKADAWQPAAELAMASARCVGLCAPSLGPSLCHGVAGSLDFLVDIYRFRRDPRVFSDIGVLQALALEFLRPLCAGHPSAHPHTEVTSPALLTGYGGVFLALLRSTYLTESCDALSVEGLCASFGRRDTIH